MKDPRSLIKPGNEDSEQIAVCAWAAKHVARYPCLRWLHHVPNGEQRGDGTARGAAIAGGRLKAMGARKGIADLHLPFPSRGYHGLMLEMKHSAIGLSAKAKVAMVSKEQQDYVDWCLTNGYCAGICYGYDEAVAAIAWYLEMREW